MILENYRKDFSIYIFSENIHMARLQKESLSQKGYEAHFYSSQSLFMQAIYLTLPHIVVLPYFSGVQEMIYEIKKISKEIQIMLYGDENHQENIMALVERQMAYDFILNPAKNIKGFQHRIDQAVEKWIISMSKEQAPASDPLKDLFAHRDLAFIENNNDGEAGSETGISELLLQKTEADAIALTLKKMVQWTGVEFAYLQHDPIKETLALSASSHGLSQNQKGLGIKYSDIPRRDDFLETPQMQNLWKEFFKNVFVAEKTTPLALKSFDQTLGYLVAFGELTEKSMTILERYGNALALILDNFAKTRWMYNYSILDSATDCLNNKAFYERMGMEVSRSRRLKLPVSLLSFQIRTENEAVVHRAAQLVAKVLKRFTRSSDAVGRVAQKRFAVVFPHTPQAAAAKKASILLGIIKAALEEKQWLDVYVSAGINEFPDQCDDSLGLLQGSEDACEQAAAFEVMTNQRLNAVKGIRL